VVKKQQDLFGGQIVAVDDDWPVDFCQRFWDEYPLHVGKRYSEKCLWRVRQKRVVEWRELIAAVRQYREWLNQRSGTTFRPNAKHASTWLNQECWHDTLGNYESNKQKSFADIVMGR